MALVFTREEHSIFRLILIFKVRMDDLLRQFEYFVQIGQVFYMYAPWFVETCPVTKSLCWGRSFVSSGLQKESNVLLTPSGRFLYRGDLSRHFILLVSSSLSSFFRFLSSLQRAGMNSCHLDPAYHFDPKFHL